MEKPNRKMWSNPWGYRESIAVAAGLVFAGWIIQWAAGAVNFHHLAWPVNAIGGSMIVLAIVGISLRPKGGLFRWMSGVELSVTLIAALVLLGIIMGLTPQYAVADGVHRHPAVGERLGFTAMTTSWPFVMIYTMTLISLGCVVARRLHRFRIADYPFYLNHIGLWLLLMAAGLGAADMRRCVVSVQKGEVTNRASDDRGEVRDLPVSIRLNDFNMEEYPPKLAVIDRVNGDVQPLEKPRYFQIDEKKTTGRIGPWQITVGQYIHQAVREGDGTYHAAAMPGAAPAVLVTVEQVYTGQFHRGWVCSGNTAQGQMTLDLDDEYTVVMTRPEPRRYVSDIDIFTGDGRSRHALLEVNHPVRVGHWRLYQYGYDTNAGRMSTYSTIELVYDPWLVPSYVGMAMMAAGALGMIRRGRKRKGERL